MGREKGEVSLKLDSLTLSSSLWNQFAFLSTEIFIILRKKNVCVPMCAFSWGFLFKNYAWICPFFHLSIVKKLCGRWMREYETRTDARESQISQFRFLWYFDTSSRKKFISILRVSEHFISSLKSRSVQVDTCVLHFHTKARLNACVHTLRYQLFSMGYMVKCVNGAMRGADNNFHASQINSVSFI